MHCSFKFPLYIFKYMQKNVGSTLKITNSFQKTRSWFCDSFSTLHSQAARLHTHTHTHTHTHNHFQHPYILLAGEESEKILDDVTTEIELPTYHFISKAYDIHYCHRKTRSCNSVLQKAWKRGTNKHVIKTP